MDGFGERLKRLRQAKDLTQAQLAEQIEVVPSAIGKYERLAGSYPSIEALIKLADFFNVSIDYLLRGIKTQPYIENNISGSMTNSHFIQANDGNVVLNGTNQSTPSPEAIELLRIYETLDGKGRLNLLSYAVEIERSAR